MRLRWSHTASQKDTASNGTCQVQPHSLPTAERRKEPQPLRNTPSQHSPRAPPTPATAESRQSGTQAQSGSTSNVDIDDCFMSYCEAGSHGSRSHARVPLIPQSNPNHPDPDHHKSPPPNAPLGYRVHMYRHRTFVSFTQVITRDPPLARPLAPRITHAELPAVIQACHDGGYSNCDSMTLHALFTSAADGSPAYGRSVVRVVFSWQKNLPPPPLRRHH